MLKSKHYLKYLSGNQVSIYSIVAYSIKISYETASNSLQILVRRNAGNETRSNKLHDKFRKFLHDFITEPSSGIGTLETCTAHVLRRRVTRGGWNWGWRRSAEGTRGAAGRA